MRHKTLLILTNNCYASIPKTNSLFLIRRQCEQSEKCQPHQGFFFFHLFKWVYYVIVVVACAIRPAWKLSHIHDLRHAWAAALGVAMCVVRPHLFVSRILIQNWWMGHYLRDVRKWRAPSKHALSRNIDVDENQWNAPLNDI